MSNASLVRILFKLTPSRLQKIRSLRLQKERYEDFVANEIKKPNHDDKILSDSALRIWSDILGKDGIIFTAEHKDEPTLRRILAETIDGLRQFQNEAKKMSTSSSIVSIASEKLLFNNVFYPSIDSLIKSLYDLDQNYIDSASALDKIRRGAATWEDYFKLVKDERSILISMDRSIGDIINFYESIKKSCKKISQDHPAKSFIAMLLLSAPLVSIGLQLVTSRNRLDSNYGVFLGLFTAFLGLLTVLGMGNIAGRTINKAIGPINNIRD